MPNQLLNFTREQSKQLGYSALFGVFSVLLGFVQFNIPGVIGVASDFREVPLLISLFYIKHPIYIAIECAISMVNIPPESSYPGAFIMHFFPLWIGIVFYRKVLQRVKKHSLLALSWIAFTGIYYAGLVLPTLLVASELLGLSPGADHFENYSNVMFSIRFEMISTALITSIFLIQLRMRQSLEDHKKNLVVVVEKKTKALAKTNKELKTMNENLDHLVKERTQKIQDQFDQLLKYAHHNSHEVRAPLSRMQGLMSIIIQENDIQSKTELIEKLKASSEELDAVVIEMNQILESEILKERKTN